MKIQGINFSMNPIGFCLKIFEAMIKIPKLAKKMRRPKATKELHIEKNIDKIIKNNPMVYSLFSASFTN